MRRRHSRLRRRYGHTRSSVKVVSRGVTGAVMWDGDSKLRGHRLLWGGPGSTVKWVAPDGFVPRSPAIDEDFRTEREAAAAVRRFLSA